MTYVQNAQQKNNIKKAFKNLPTFKATAKA